MQGCFNFAQFIPCLIGKFRPAFLVPVAMAVLIAACSSSSKEAANALALALNPQAPPRGDDPTVFVRGTEEFVVKGVADRRVNNDVNGRSLSVVVRVIQLRDKNEFTRLSFDAVTSRSDADLFPKDFVAASEVVLTPGMTQEITDKLLPEARYVGVIGYFRRPDAQFWRLLFDARAVRNEGLVFAARDCHFTAMTPRFEPVPGQRTNYKPTCTGVIPPIRSRR